jgi:uncharacterized phiE125 gp8 family phage protein
MAVTETGPVPIAVPVEEARAWLRLGGGADEPELAAALRSATMACEGWTGVTLIERVLTEVRNISGDWQRLGARPVRAITLVEGLPADGAAVLLPVDAYAIDIDAEAQGLVRVMRPGISGRMRVTYRAGLATSAGELPEALRQGIMLRAAQILRLRDEAGAQGTGEAEALWAPWRRLRLG